MMDLIRNFRTFMFGPPWEDVITEQGKAMGGMLRAALGKEAEPLISDQERRQWANANTGYYRHSPICTCLSCQASYKEHNLTKWCACDTCQIQTRNRNDPYKSNAKGKTTVASVNFCDRCESMAKSNVMGELTFMPNQETAPTHLEICPGCVVDFMTWKSEDIMTHREKGYKEPWREDSEKAEESSVIVTNKEGLKKLLLELESGEME